MDIVNMQAHSLRNNTVALQKEHASTNLNKYHSFFGKLKEQVMLQSLLSDLETKGNIIHLEEPYSYFQMKIIRHSPKFQAVQLEVRIFQFLFEIFVYNSDQTSLTHKLPRIRWNFQPSIFKNEVVLSGRVIRCIHFPHYNIEKSLAMAVKELCLHKLAAILNIGPQLSNYFGFDMLLFKDCAEFCMEQCRPIYEFSVEMENVLKKKLLSLHSLSIVHLDIKPESISFSPSLNQVVFLNFGLSDMIEEPVGKRTKTPYIGTLGFSSPEMVEGYNNRCESDVDLYYNDVFCLQRTINETSHLRQNLLISEQEQMYAYIYPFERDELSRVKLNFLLINLKFCIFTQKMDFLNDKVIAFSLNRLKYQLAQFCLDFPYSRYMEYIFLNLGVNYQLQCIKKNMKQRSTTERFQIFARESYAIQDSGTRLQPLAHGIILKRNSLKSEEIQKNISIKDIILNIQATKLIKNEIYFQKMVSFLDFHTNIATFKERAQAALTMKVIFNVSETNKQMDEFSDIESCLMYLLNYYITEQKEICADLIPKIWRNLILIGKLSVGEVRDVANRIIKMNLTNQKLFVLLIFRFIIAGDQLLYLKDFDKTLIKQIYDANTMARNYLLVLKGGQQSKKFAAFIYKLLKLQNQHNVSKLSQFQNEFYNIKNEINPRMFRQLLIFFHNLQMKWIKQMECIQKIKELQLKKQHKAIQYYHFSYSSMMVALGNYSILYKFYSYLKQCLDHQGLLKRYKIYYQHRQQDENFTLESAIQDFTIFINQTDLTKMSNKMSCLGFIQTLCNKMPRNMRLQDLHLNEILQKLRQQLPLSLIKQFKDYFQIESTHLFGGITQMAFLFIKVMEKLHEQDLCRFKEIDSFIAEIKEKWRKVGCKVCNFQLQQTLALIESFTLSARVRYTEAGQVLRLLLSDSNVCISRGIQCLVLMVEANERAYLPFAYEWINRNDAWVYVLKSRQSKAFKLVSHHLILEQNYKQFLLVQLKYLDIIKNFPLDCFVYRYIVQLVYLAFSFRYIEQQLWRNIDQTIMSKLMMNDSSILFFSVLLARLQVDDSQKFTQVIKFINRRINTLRYSNKRIVCNYFYYILIKMSIKDSSRFKQRKINHFCKIIRKDNYFNIHPRQLYRRLFKINLEEASSHIVALKTLEDCFETYFSRSSLVQNKLKQTFNIFPSLFDPDEETL